MLFFFFSNLIVYICMQVTDFHRLYFLSSAALGRRLLGIISLHIETIIFRADEGLKSIRQPVNVFRSKNESNYCGDEDLGDRRLQM